MVIKIYHFDQKPGLLGVWLVQLHSRKKRKRDVRVVPNLKFFFVNVTYIILICYKWVTRTNLRAPFCCLNWFEIQHGGTNKVANEVVEGHINHSVHV